MPLRRPRFSLLGLLLVTCGVAVAFGLGRVGTIQAYHGHGYTYSYLAWIVFSVTLGAGIGGLIGGRRAAVAGGLVGVLMRPC